jgi:hypothetical protein
MIKYNPSFMSEKDAKQLSEAIKTYKEDKEQPKGRFIILGTIPKENN